MQNWEYYWGEYFIVDIQCDIVVVIVFNNLWINVFIIEIWGGVDVGDKIDGWDIVFNVSG